MPELPEVEVVRRGLQDRVAGRTVAAVHLEHPRVARRHAPGPADLVGRCVGRAAAWASRRGKYLWMPLEGTPDALVVHLGMSGQLLVAPPGAPDGPHLRARLRFADDGPELRFVDQRTFGALAVDPLVDDGAGGRLPASVAHVARDPLDPAFDDAGFVRGLRARRTGVKRALLDQRLLSGVGNIYADEALWRSRLHGGRPAAGLSPAAARGLLADVRAVLSASLAAGGTSFDALYVDVNGRSGRYGSGLQAYGRHGRPCARCGTPVVREPFMNRSSFRCPGCQPAPRAPRRA